MPKDEEDSDKKLNKLQKALLLEIAGKDGMKIGQYLFQNSVEVTDEELADKTAIKLNLVRKILYKLNENKLAKFRRVRDKKSGWFIYYWSHDFDRIVELVTMKQRKVLRKLQSRLDFEQENMFFVCSQKCNDERYSFDEAVELTFACPNCRGKLEFQQNEPIKNLLKQKIEALKAEIVKQ
ncbi:MAG: transcription factor IIE (TFIIE) subunit alpha [Promethearchaeota archaeon CR_4]|nr:MAG: transcription factor IIE (TFIIE) subunit alpha [Candidatus Lokiarchaeota archaeon CR_4]